MYAELLRRFENLIRFGAVAEVNLAATPPAVRMTSGGLTSDWLPWISLRAGASKEWDPPTVGEAGIILSPGDPSCGVVLLGLFTDANPAPSTSADEHLRTYPDGARICYNHATGALTASGIKTAEIQASTSVTIDSPLTRCTGNLIVDKQLTYKGGLDNDGTGTGATITGPITHTNGNLTSNGVVVHTHRHQGDSGGTTGEPL